MSAATNGELSGMATEALGSSQQPLATLAIPI